MAQRSMKLAAIVAALAILAGGIALEISDDAAANAGVAGLSEPFMGR